MATYVLADVDVHDVQAYEPYKDAVPATIALYGGRYLARGGRTEVLEGERAPKRLVIVEFPTVERARAWLNSPEYAFLRTIRHPTASSSLILVEGL